VFDPDGSVHQVPLPERTRRASPMAPEDRRSAILRAAIPLLRTRGTTVTTRELADAAGVAEGTLFRVFVDKEELVRAAIELALDPAPLVARLAEIDPDADLRATLREAVGILQVRSGDIAVLMSVIHELSGGRAPHGPPAHGPGRHPVEMVVQAFAGVLHAHLEQLRLDPATCARVLVGLVMVNNHPLSVRDLPALTADQIVELFLDGALVRPSSTEKNPC
jgi:AcrR family transcriptional regulator